MKFGIGQSMARVEDQRLLQGTGQFVDDALPTGTAAMVFVRSPYPRASLVSIDAAAARTADGVIGHQRKDGERPVEARGNGLQRAHVVGRLEDTAPRLPGHDRVLGDQERVVEREPVPQSGEVGEERGCRDQDGRASEGRHGGAHDTPRAIVPS